jgi:hypothetical protein
MFHNIPNSYPQISAPISKQTCPITIYQYIGKDFSIIISSKAIKDIMGMALSYNTRGILFTILVIIFFILAISSQHGVDSRPLQDEQFDGLFMQLLPRGPSKPSTPDPMHHH